MNTKEGEIKTVLDEDDGSVTGVQPTHQDTTGLKALIANRTSPSVAISTEIIEQDEKKILGITVPKSHSIVSTTDGLVLRRRLMASGRPEAVPFYPHEFIQRQVHAPLSKSWWRPG